MVQIHPGPPFLGAVAQLGERGLCKPEVVGSNPISSTIVLIRFFSSFFQFVEKNLAIFLEFRQRESAARSEYKSALRGQPSPIQAGSWNPPSAFRGSSGL